MAAAFRTRPWPQLLAARPSRHLEHRLTQTGGILSGYHPSTQTPITTRLPLRRHYASAKHIAQRGGHSPLRSVPGLMRQTPHRAPKTEQLEALVRNNLKVDQISFMLPYTFVAQSLSSCPRNPRDFVAYQWARIKQRAINFFTTTMYQISTKPTIFGRAKWKADRSKLVPMAKAMHREMSEALARGDKPGLRRLLNEGTFKKLAASIDARRRGRRFGWELVRYTKAPWIADHKVNVMPLPFPGVAPPAIRQVVVAIPSRQRLVEFDDTRGGAVVEGSERERDMLEYVVLVQVIDAKTREPSEWRLWGTTKETTLQEWRAMVDAVKKEEEKGVNEERRKTLGPSQ